MNIYLVRHGEVEHNRLGYYSNEDEDLNEKGIEQAEKLKTTVRGLDYDVCYCSPLKRAVHTAEIINSQDRLIVPIQLLAERDPMALHGKPIDFTDREEYWSYYSTVEYGAEPIKGFFERVYKFLDALKARPYRNVLIVAHSGVSKAFYGYFNGIPADGRFLHLGLKNCEMKKYWLEGAHDVLPGSHVENWM